MIERSELVEYCNHLLDINNYQDYCPNGLQIQGTDKIKKIAFAVSATYESVAKAVEIKADALIVHHGLFWKFHGVKTITDAFYHRISPLIKNDINLIGYHLPLDGHLEIGNAASIAQLIPMENLSEFGNHKGMHTGVKGNLKKKTKVSDLQIELENILKHKITLSTYDSNAEIMSLGIITGGANSDWIQAKKDGLDAYLTGEMSEHDWHEAKESGIHFFAGGHNATEQFGVQSLMRKLHQEYANLEYFFIPSDNPA